MQRTRGSKREFCVCVCVWRKVVKFEAVWREWEAKREGEILRKVNIFAYMCIYIHIYICERVKTCIWGDTVPWAKMNTSSFTLYIWERLGDYIRYFYVLKKIIFLPIYTFTVSVYIMRFLYKVLLPFCIFSLSYYDGSFAYDVEMAAVMHKTAHNVRFKG